MHCAAALKWVEAIYGDERMREAQGHMEHGFHKIAIRHVLPGVNQEAGVHKDHDCWLIHADGVPRNPGQEFVGQN